MKYRKYIYNVINRILVAFVVIFALLILKKVKPTKSYYLKNKIFSKSLSFININTISKKLIGKEVFYNPNKNNEMLVFSDITNFNNVEKHGNSESFLVSDNLPIGSIQSGVVIFIGEKEDLGNTVIIQGIDNYNIWYGNLKNNNVSLYDYVEKGTLIGECSNNKLYLLIEKDNHIYSYEEYKNN